MGNTSFRRRYALLAALFLASASYAQEICNNGIDDDGDGLIDLNDTTECACAPLTVVPSGSLITNPSFEIQDCIPDNFSQLICAHGWAQATLATTDYFSTNGYMPSTLPPPVGGGIGLAGAIAMPGWQEYLGTCLASPMLAGQQYSITLSVALLSESSSLMNIQPTTYGPIDITIFGTTSCPTWPLTTYNCPMSAGWMELGHTTYSPSADWSPITITFTPTADIQAVMLGSPCVLPPEYAVDANFFTPYFVFDDLILHSTEVHVAVEDTGSFCRNDRVLIAHPDALIGTYQWYLDGAALVGSTDTVLDLSAQGLGPGTYQFRVDLGDTACIISPWQVADDLPPILHVAAAPHSGCQPLAVAFTNTTAADSVSTIQWQFGDGGSSTADDPTHTYTDPGSFDVTLAVTAPNGCMADTLLADWIEVYPAPVAGFMADPTEGCSGMQVQFTNTTGPLTDQTAWTFGDGGSSTANDPLHTYLLAGHHDVHLIVTTADGCVDDTLMQQLIFTHPAPDISFTGGPLEGCVPLTVQFTNTTPAAQVATVHWDFGQGATSNDAAPSSTYDVPGVYDVHLSVADNIGCTADTTITGMVVTHGHPVPSFTFSPDSGCVPLAVTFVDLTDPSFHATCAWDFGDGGSSTVCDVVHTYTGAGLYSVTLATTSEFGCDGDTTLTDIITVFAHPEAAFTFGPQPTDVFQTQQHFVNTSSGDAITWDWTFTSGDPNFAHIPDPAVLFPGDGPGEYPVQLVVSNEHNCRDTAMAIVVINGYFSVHVPNAFTPDGDGVNDVWAPVIEDQDRTRYRLLVFDRWGEEIWASNDPTQGWDGRVNGTPVQDGVYAWKLVARDATSRINREYLGHVTLLH